MEEHMPEWFEDEIFWEKLYPFMFPDKVFEAAEGEIEKALVLADFHGGDVLDLACGPGRHSVALAGKGYRVTGVDRSPFLLARAEERGRSGNVSIEWIEEDMRRFKRAEAFDLVVNLFTSFGYFDDGRDDALVLTRIYQNLKPGGALIMDILGKELMARHFRHTISAELDDGTLFIQRHEIIDGWGRVRNQWILVENDEAVSFRFQTTLYSGKELKILLKQTGFKNSKLFGDLDGNEYGVNARRLIAVAWK
jgi:SAM-dependent methyltransferase